MPVKKRAKTEARAAQKKPAPPLKKKPAAAKKKTAAKARAKKKTATAKKKTATAKKKTATAKKKTATAKKTTATAKKKTATAKKKRTATAKKKTATAKKKRTATTSRAVSPPRPSDRALAVAAQLPVERSLTDEERDAMSKCALTALATLAVDGAPAVIVKSVGAFVDEIRIGGRPAPTSQDVRLGLGVLWGEQVRAQVGWRWVHLSYPNGFASYALVPDDRAFACFPLNRLGELLTPSADGLDTSVHLFESIRTGALPARRENAYLVIG
jgi:hypothetical protein